MEIALTTVGVEIAKHASIYARLRDQETGRLICVNLLRCKGICVKLDDLELAYALIRRFKVGGIETHSSIDEQQEKLIALLCKDLLPNTEFSKNRIGEIIEEVAAADTFWNRRAQNAVSEIYAFLGEKNSIQAEKCRDNFVRECPSVWYRRIVESV